MKRSFIPATRTKWRVALLTVAALALLISGGINTHWGDALPTLGPARAASASQAPHAGAAFSDALDPRVAIMAKEHPSRPIEAIVQFKAQVSPARARADARRAHARLIEQVNIIHGLALQVSARQARLLANSGDVHAVSLNAPVAVQAGGPGSTQLQTTFDQSLDMPALWRMGGTGDHVGVAVIDTGIDGELADFRAADAPRSRVLATAVANPQAKTVTDSYGHGTDVAGIVAGNGANRAESDPLRAQYIGIAPDANLVSIKVSDEVGNATVLDVINGLEFAIEQQQRYDIRVVNLSLDSTTPQPYQTDPLDAAVEAAWFHGIVVVAAAGNRGQASDAVQYAPANDPFVITVGAVDEHGTPDPASHTIAEWSSRGTTQDGFAKPEVYAPGAHIVSDLAPGSLFAGMCSSCIVDGQYIRTSGTSMAAPMISGLVADVLELHRHWTPDEVKGALTSSASWSDGLPEVDAVKLAQLDQPPLADQNLAPNQMLDSATGNIDYTKSSWSKSSWSIATGSLSAGFAKSSWSCSCGAASSGVDPSGSLSTTATWGTTDLR